MSVTRLYSRALTLLAGAFLSIGWIPSAFPETVVTIGAYHFPPVADIGPDRRPKGLLGDLIPALEAAHEDLDIRFFHTSSKRRYMDFEAGLYDVILFESADWGWREHNATISQPVLVEEEVYIALNKPDRNQSFFDNISERRIVAMAGYHYGFANGESDPEVLNKSFNIEFSSNHGRCLQLIKADRPSLAEVAIINRSYLHSYVSDKEFCQSKLLISDKPDQRYELRFIAREGSPVSADDMARLLTPLIENGTYQELVAKWGLQLPHEFDSGFTAANERPE